MFRNVKYAYYFRNEKELEHFTDRMAGHVDLELSPFVGGAAVTSETLFEKSPDPPLGAALQKLLKMFGMHIRKLKIKTLLLDVVRFAECLNFCLHFVPNL